MFANIEEAGNFGSNLAREIKDYTSTRVVKPLEERIKQLEVKIAYLEAKLEAHRSVRYIPQATLEWCDRHANRDGLIQQLDHRMSAIGPKRTSGSALHMSAFGGEADMTLCGNSLSRSLLAAKRTWPCAPHMSAFDPKRTSAEEATCPHSQRFTPLSYVMRGA